MDSSAVAGCAVGGKRAGGKRSESGRRRTFDAHHVRCRYHHDGVHELDNDEYDDNLHHRADDGDSDDHHANDGHSYDAAHNDRHTDNGYSTGGAADVSAGRTVAAAAQWR